MKETPEGLSYLIRAEPKWPDQMPAQSCPLRQGPEGWTEGELSADPAGNLPPKNATQRASTKQVRGPVTHEFRGFS